MTTRDKAIAYITGILAAELFGLALMFAIHDAAYFYYEGFFQLPDINPPAWMHSVIWTGVLALTAAGVVRTLLDDLPGGIRLHFGILLALQAILYAASVYYVFMMPVYLIALVLLGALFVAAALTAAISFTSDKLAGILQLPYLLLLLFCVYQVVSMLKNNG